MSITQLASKSFSLKHLHNISELASRSRFLLDSNVYLPMKSRLCHPTFYEFFDHPPTPYSLFKPYVISHCINYVPSWQLRIRSIFKPSFVVEFVDHPVSFLYTLLPRSRKPTPSSVHSLISKSKSNLLDINFSAFVFQHQWHASYFKSLYPFLSHIPNSIVPLAFPDHTSLCSLLALADGSDLHTTRFLCIASDFYSKGLFVLLTAWDRLSSSKKKVAELTIVANSIPAEYKHLCSHPSIKIITKRSSMSTEDKCRLYSSSHCFINVALTDSGINAEALSFGLPIITTQLLSTDMYVDHSNGFTLSIPLHYYGNTALSYYDSFDSYKVDLFRLWDLGAFEGSILALLDAITSALNNQTLYSMAICSIHKYRSNFAYPVRNKRLIELYSSAALEF